MLINIFLYNIQQLIKPIYEKSIFLKNIDIFIFCTILGVIISSQIMPSDYIGYFAIITILLNIIKILTKPNEKFSLELSDKFLLLYFIFVIISLAGSTLFILSLKGFFKTLTYLGFYISLIHFFKDNKDKIKYIFLSIILCISFESIIAFLQNFTSIGEISGWQDTSRLNPEEVMTRVYGTLKPYNPNLFGGYLLACIPAVIPFSKKISIPIGIFSSIALILTGCRGSYIGYFFELMLLGIIVYKSLKTKLKEKFIIISSSIITIITTIILSISALRARILSIFAMRNDSSNSFRFNVYNSCIEMFKDNWLLGIGIGNQNFREIYGLYMKTGFDALSAYNIYLETAVESGIFALISFLCFLIFTIKKALTKLSNKYILASLISITGILVHGMVDTVFFRPQIQFIFWIMIATIRSNND